MRSQVKEFTLDLIQEIKSSCQDIDEYLQILSGIILKRRLSFNKVELEFAESSKIAVFKELHASWCQEYSTPPSPNQYKINIPAILAWGYELRLKRVTEVWFNDFCLHKLDTIALTALWESIKISRINTFKGLKFDKQTDTAWEICLDAIKRSSLDSLHFGGGYGEFSLNSWQSFWNTVNHSSIKHLNFCFAHFHKNGNRFWEIFFNGIENSNLTSLCLERMDLSKQFSLEQWNRLYQAIGRSKLISLDLTSNYINDCPLPYNKNCPASWEIICNIIQLPSLKHLKMMEFDSSTTSDEGWKKLCTAFEKSKLKKIEFSVDAYKTGVTEERWSILLNAFKKISSLNSLHLSVDSANSVSVNVLHGLCDLLKNSNIEFFSLIPEHGSLAYPAADWQLLFTCFKEKMIDIFNMGAIKLANESDFMNFAAGLKNSSITSLHLHHSALGQISSERWMQLANLLKEEGITDLNLIGEYIDCSLNSHTWPDFCDFIVKSGIRKLAFSASNSNAMNDQQIYLLSEAIKSSQLESFSFKGLLSNMDKTPLQSFKMLCSGIHNSRIYELIHIWIPGKITLCPEKQKVLNETLELIKPRALFKKSLGELSALSLLNSKAMLTDNGMEFEKDNVLIHYDLDEGQINILKNYGIS